MDGMWRASGGTFATPTSPHAHPAAGPVQNVPYAVQLLERGQHGDQDPQVACLVRAQDRTKLGIEHPVEVE